HFSRCCYLRIDLGSRPLDGSWARTWAQSPDSAVELGSFVSTSRPRRAPLCGCCCAVVHTLLRSPTTYAAGPTTCAPQPLPLASWHSFLRARPASVPSAADRCPVQRAPECIARPAPSAFLDSGLLPC